jgi:hypothetical protein
MSDITERPPEGRPESAPAAPPSDGITPLGAMPSLEEPMVYRPLSVVAIIGFCVSLLFVLCLSIFVIFALFTRSPFMPSAVIFVIPLFAVIICLLARQQVRGSEGTLSGEKLANWGIGLSAIVTLLFGAYYLATAFAIRQQAADFADQWIEGLKSGDPIQAYWYLIPPEKRVDVPLPKTPADSANLRASFEVVFNNPNAPIMRYSEFRRGEVMSLFRTGGDKVRQQIRVERTGVGDPDYVKGTYEVAVHYRVHTPDMVQDLKVMVTGKESPTDFEGRQWYVEGKTTNFPEAGTLTELGRQHTAEGIMARGFAERWSSGLSSSAHFKLTEHDLRILRSSSALAAAAPDAWGDALLAKFAPMKDKEYPSAGEFAFSLGRQVALHRLAGYAGAWALVGQLQSQQSLVPGPAAAALTAAIAKWTVLEDPDRVSGLVMKYAEQANNDPLYIATLPVVEQAAAKEALDKAAAASFPALTGADVLGAVTDTGRKQLVGRRELDTGNVVQLDPDFIAPDKKLHKDIEGVVRGMFLPGPDRRRGHMKFRTGGHDYRDEDGHVQVSLEADIELANQVDGRVTGSLYSAEAVFVVEGVRQQDQIRWYVKALRLTGGRRAKDAPGQ